MTSTMMECQRRRSHFVQFAFVLLSLLSNNGIESYQLSSSTASRSTNPPPLTTKSTTTTTTTTTNNSENKRSSSTWQTTAVTAALSLVLSTAVRVMPAQAADGSSNTAAQIYLNNLPPTSISVQIQDLPVVGSLLSGTYTKVADGSVSSSSPSVVIKSPTDKVKAIQQIATNGHLEFDVNGLLSTHVDVDVAAEKAGVAKVRVTSDLIPKLPFKNSASSSSPSSSTAVAGGGTPSPWNMVTNMGTGESYYYNEKTGVTQYARPVKF